MRNTIKPPVGERNGELHIRVELITSTLAPWIDNMDKEGRIMPTYK